jgi:hypothetical protein
MERLSRRGWLKGIGGIALLAPISAALRPIDRYFGDSRTAAAMVDDERAVRWLQTTNTFQSAFRTSQKRYGSLRELQGFELPAKIGKRYEFHELDDGFEAFLRIASDGRAYTVGARVKSSGKGYLRY